MVHGAGSAASAVEATTKLVTDAATTSAAATTEVAAKATKTLGQADLSGLWKELGQLATGITSAVDKGYAQTMEFVTAVVKVLVEIIVSIVDNIVSGATSLYKSLSLKQGMEEILHVPRVIVSGISKELTESWQYWSVNPEKLCEKIFLIVMTILAIAILKKAYDSRQAAKQGSDLVAATAPTSSNSNGIPKGSRTAPATLVFDGGSGSGPGAAVLAKPPSKPPAAAAPVQSPTPSSSAKPKPYFPVEEPRKKSTDAKPSAPSSSAKPVATSSPAAVETKKKKKEKKEKKPNEWINGTVVFLQALRDYIGEVKPKTGLQEDKVYYTVPASSAQSGPLQTPPALSKPRPVTPYDPNAGLEFLYAAPGSTKASGNGVHSNEPIPADLQFKVAEAVKKEEHKAVESAVPAAGASQVQMKVVDVIKGNVQFVEPEPVKVAPEPVKIVEPAKVDAKVEAKVVEPVVVVPEPVAVVPESVAVIPEPVKAEVKIAEAPTVVLGEDTSAVKVAAPATNPVESPEASIAAPPSVPESSSPFQSTIYPSPVRSRQKKAGRIIRVVPPQI